MRPSSIKPSSIKPSSIKPSSIVLATLFVGLAAGWGWAQVSRTPNRAPVPVVVSGSDLGFRIDGHQGELHAGTLVVRVNGIWVPVRIQHEESIRWGD